MTLNKNYLRIIENILLKRNNTITVVGVIGGSYRTGITRSTQNVFYTQPVEKQSSRPGLPLIWHGINAR